MSYILIGPKGEENGPYEISQLSAWAQSGDLPPDAPVRNSQTGESSRAIDLPDLRHAFPPGAVRAGPKGSSMIPSDNPKALTSYYVGVGSLACCLVGPLAIHLGLKGLKFCRENPEAHGKAHAITGIVLGSLTSLGLIFALVLLALNAATGQP